MTTTEPEGLSVSDACTRAGVSRRTLYRAIMDGSLPSQVVAGRRIILADQLEQWSAPVERRRKLLGD